MILDRSEPDWELAWEIREVEKKTVEIGFRQDQDITSIAERDIEFLDTMRYHGVIFSENNRFWGFRGVIIKEDLNEEDPDKYLQEF